MMNNEMLAQQHLQQYLNSKEVINQYPIARYPAIDIGEFIGFSLMPQNIGKAGEILYLVSNDKILIAGNHEDVVYLMQYIVSNNITVSLEKIIALVYRFYLLQPAIVLTSGSDEYFPEKTGFLENNWTQPVFEQNNTGISFDCWLLNTNSFVPFHVKGDILANGEITTTQ